MENMQFGSWAITAAVFAVLESCLVLLFAVAGLMLRLSQESVIGTDIFLFVRLRGLTGATRRLVRTVVNGEFRVLCTPGFLKGWRNIAGAAAMIVSAVVLTSFMSLLATGFLPSGELPSDRWLLWPAVTVFGGGTITGTCLWLSGLSYVARAGTRRRGSLPRLVVPGPPRRARKVRDDLALRIYWSSRLGWAAWISAMAPWVLLGVSQIGAQSAPPPVGAQEVTDFLGELLVIVAGVIASFTVARLIGRGLVFDRLAAEICSLLDSAATGKPGLQGKDASLIADPLRGWRTDLALIAAHLPDAARALDARQVAGAVPHPVSTLLRAVSQNVLGFLRSDRSWSKSVPDDLTELLHSVVVLIAMPGELASYKALLQRVPAFDKDGHPAVDPGERPPRLIVTIASRATAGINGFVAAAVSVATFTALVTVVTLFALHRMNTSDFLHYMP
jgi:hypothetical protein